MCGSSSNLSVTLSEARSAKSKGLFCTCIAKRGPSTTLRFARDDGDWSLPIRQRLQHLDQHARAGSEVGGRGILDLVVADAALARHEDHAGGAELGDVHGVVPRARRH